MQVPAISYFYNDYTRQKTTGAEAFTLHAAMISAALLIPTLLAYSIDDRQLNDVNIWAKPLKFQLSLAMHQLSLLLIAMQLKDQMRTSRAIRYTLYASGVSTLFEVGYITFQAARGRASHFNNDTVWEAAAYSLMGVGAYTLMICVVVLAVIFIYHASNKTGKGLYLGVTLGLVLGGVFTTLVGGYIAGQSAHLVGGTSDASGMLLTGWSTKWGDLRVPHFFSTHLIQILPITGLIADKLSPAYAIPVTIAVTLIMSALIIVTFVQALLGLPVL